MCDGTHAVVVLPCIGGQNMTPAGHLLRPK
jgi:hypothetical protein